MEEKRYAWVSYYKQNKTKMSNKFAKKFRKSKEYRKILETKISLVAIETDMISCCGRAVSWRLRIEGCESRLRTQENLPKEEQEISGNNTRLFGKWLMKSFSEIQFLEFLKKPIYFWNCSFTETCFTSKFQVEKSVRLLAEQNINRSWL